MNWCEPSALRLPGLVAYRAQVPFARLDAQAVHRIDIVLARGSVAPKEIALAVAVVVADRRDLPGGVGRAHVAFAGDAGSIHEIEIVFAGRVVAPRDVGLAVAVEVANAFHLPGELG